MESISPRCQPERTQSQWPLEVLRAQLFTGGVVIAPAGYTWRLRCRRGWRACETWSDSKHLLCLQCCYTSVLYKGISDQGYPDKKARISDPREWHVFNFDHPDGGSWQCKLPSSTWCSNVFCFFWDCLSIALEKTRHHFPFQQIQTNCLGRVRVPHVSASGVKDHAAGGMVRAVVENSITFRSDRPAEWSYSPTF